MASGDHRRRADRLPAPPAPRRQSALRPRRRVAPDLLGRGLRGDHRVRLAHGRHVHQPAVPAERARRTRRSAPARRSCRRSCSWCSSRRARPSSSRPAAPASRCCAATCSCSARSCRCCSCGRRASPTGRSASRTCSSASASGSRARPLRTRSPARCPCAAPAWRRARRTSSAISAARSCSRSSARCSPPATRRPPRPRSRRRPTTRRSTSSVQNQLTKSFAGAESVAEQYPQYASQITAAAKQSFLDGDQWAYAAGVVAVVLGAALVMFLFPRKREERRAARALQRGGHGPGRATAGSRATGDRLK